jgi:hypothetical protein
MKGNWVAILKNKGLSMLKDEKIIKKNFKAVEDLLEFKKK